MHKRKENTPVEWAARAEREREDEPVDHLVDHIERAERADEDVGQYVYEYVDQELGHIDVHDDALLFSPYFSIHVSSCKICKIFCLHLSATKVSSSCHFSHFSKLLD